MLLWKNELIATRPQLLGLGLGLGLGIGLGLGVGIGIGIGLGTPDCDLAHKVA